MRKIFLPFHRASIGRGEINEVADSLKSGWLTTGPRVKVFEEKFKKFVGAKYALAVNSCTAALHLGLAAIGLKAGDEVIVPTMTFTATAEVVTYFGAMPVFADCDPDTLLITADEIKKRITARTKAVIPVHYGGQSCDIDAILAVARKHNLKVIWDAAHALPTIYKGKLVGAFPDVTCFSFYATKTITTGEGGAAVTDKEVYYEKMKILSMHGMDRNIWKRYTKEGSWYYEILAPGFKYNMTDMAASLGIVQLRKCTNFHKKRKKIAGIYTKAFKNSAVFTPLSVNQPQNHSWHLFVVKLNPEKISIDRDQFIEELKNRNIGTGVHFIPLHLQPYWKKNYNLKEKKYPNTTKAYQQIVSLPIFPDMTEKDANDVIKAAQDIAKKYGQ